MKYMTINTVKNEENEILYSQIKNFAKANGILLIDLVPELLKMGLATFEQQFKIQNSYDNIMKGIK